jgi:predicted O-methyltransferase YrrM
MKLALQSQTLASRPPALNNARQFMRIGPLIDKVVTTLRLRRHGLARHMGVFSHTSPAERLALFEMASKLPPGARALEIGAHIGSSALFICAGLAHGGGHLICVDTWTNETMPDGVKDTYAEFNANTRPYAHMITTVRKRSSELLGSDVGGPLDFAFIDGDHSESAVRADFRVVAPWVKPGGLIAFHDLIAFPVFPGVHIVVGQALASGDWQLVRLTGCLGAIRRARQ